MVNMINFGILYLRKNLNGWSHAIIIVALETTALQDLSYFWLHRALSPLPSPWYWRRWCQDTHSYFATLPSKEFMGTKIYTEMDAKCHKCSKFTKQLSSTIKYHKIISLFNFYFVNDWNLSNLNMTNMIHIRKDTHNSFIYRVV